VEGGEGEGEVSLGFVHSLFGMVGTPSHILMVFLHCSSHVFPSIPQFSAALAHSSLLYHISCASLRVGQLGVICPGPHLQHPAQSQQIWPGPLHLEQWWMGWWCEWICCLIWKA